MADDYNWSTPSTGAMVMLLNKDFLNIPAETLADGFGPATINWDNYDNDDVLHETTLIIYQQTPPAMTAATSATSRGGSKK